MNHRVSEADAARIARFRPASGMETPRFAGLASFMRLTVRAPDSADGVEIGLVGIPFDGATTNRPGARLGPRGVREASTGTRMVNHASGIAPYALAACADLGDVPVNPIDAAETCRRIEAFFAGLRARGIVPLAVGGDHLVTYPILRALGQGRPLAYITQSERSLRPRAWLALWMATISAWSVASFVRWTVFAAVATTVPSRTITAP